MMMGAERRWGNLKKVGGEDQPLVVWGGAHPIEPYQLTGSGRSPSKTERIDMVWETI